MGRRARNRHLASGDDRTSPVSSLELDIGTVDRGFSVLYLHAGNGFGVVMRRFSSHPVSPRRGAAALDAALVLGVILPLATIVIPASIYIIRSVYEMFVTLVAWPFL